MLALHPPKWTRFDDPSNSFAIFNRDNEEEDDGLGDSSKDSNESSVKEWSNHEEGTLSHDAPPLEDEDNDFHDAIKNDSESNKGPTNDGVGFNIGGSCEGPVFKAKTQIN